MAHNVLLPVHSQYRYNFKKLCCSNHAKHSKPMLVECTVYHLSACPTCYLTCPLIVLAALLTTLTAPCFLDSPTCVPNSYASCCCMSSTQPAAPQGYSGSEADRVWPIACRKTPIFYFLVIPGPSALVPRLPDSRLFSCSWLTAIHNWLTATPSPALTLMGICLEIKSAVQSICSLVKYFWQNNLTWAITGFRTHATSIPWVNQPALHTHHTTRLLWWRGRHNLTWHLPHCLGSLAFCPDFLTCCPAFVQAIPPTAPLALLLHWLLCLL